MRQLCKAITTVNNKNTPRAEARKQLNDAAPNAAVLEKKRELLLFLFLTIVFFPLLAIGLVGGYGFVIWIMQLLMGPPGPPTG